MLDPLFSGASDQGQRVNLNIITHLGTHLGSERSMVVQC